MQLQNFYAQDVNGNIVPGAVCSLFLPGTTTLATGLVDVNGDPLANPFAANSNGLVQLAAPNGAYDLKIEAGLIVSTLPIVFADTLQALAQLGGFLPPSATPPTTRVDGSPLQIGDRYMKTPEDIEYIYKTSGWEPNNLDGQLIGSDAGASLVGFIQSGMGAVPETVQRMLRHFIFVTSYGAKCDALTVGTDDTIAIKRALDEAALRGGGQVFIPGFSLFSETLITPPGVGYKSLGKGYDKQPRGGLIWKGTAPKDFTIAGATSISIVNPDAGAPYLADSGTRGDVYKTVDLSAPFSAAIVFDKAAWTEDMGIFPWFDGLSGYTGPGAIDDGRLSDDCDVGIWVRNASGWRVENTIVDGHWRKFGVLVTSSDIGDGKIPECELGQASFSFFGGFRGLGIRAPRDASGATNYGFAGTDFINCYIRSLNHQSAHLATSDFLDTPFDSPSACMELDGSTVLRGVQFINCTFLGRDDICIISDHCSEFIYSACYEESKTIRINGAWNDNTLGSRMVATPNSVIPRFEPNTKYGVDFSPYYTKDVSLTSGASRYDINKNGVFNPATAYDSEWVRPNFSASLGDRLRENQIWRIYNYLFDSIFSITQLGAVTAAGGLSIGDSLVVRQDAAGVYAQSTANPIIRRYASGTVQLANGASALSDGTMTNPGIVRPSTTSVYSSGSATFQWSDVFSVKGTFSGPIRCGQFTLATLPSAAAFSGYEIDVTDAAGGPKRCRSNGSVWQILNTTTTVS